MRTPWATPSRVTIASSPSPYLLRPHRVVDYPDLLHRLLSSSSSSSFSPLDMCLCCQLLSHAFCRTCINSFDPELSPAHAFPLAVRHSRLRGRCFIGALSDFARRAEGAGRVGAGTGQIRLEMDNGGMLCEWWEVQCAGGDEAQKDVVVSSMVILTILRLFCRSLGMMSVYSVRQVKQSEAPQSGERIWTDSPLILRGEELQETHAMRLAHFPTH